MPRAQIRYRRCRQKDLVPAARLVMRSLNHLLVRVGKDRERHRVRSAPPLFKHLLRTDPQRHYCAWRGERIVGFASALLRGKQWYLAFLFVDPRCQDRGIGKKLIEKVWHEGRGVSHALATFPYNMQAVGLYSRFGMVPEEVFTLMRAPLPKLIVPPPTGLQASPVGRGDMAWIHDLERRIRGYTHRPEWRFWRAEGSFRISVFRHRGKRIGYSMIGKGGGIAPVGAISPRLQQKVLAETLRLASEAWPKNAAKMRLVVTCPQTQRENYRLLLDAGFRNLEILLFMSDTPYADFRRYLPATLAVF